MRVLLSNLEREILELLRVHRCMGGKTLTSLYAPEDHLALSIALNHLIHETMVSYEEKSDLFRATPLDKPDERRLSVLEYFITLHPDEDACRYELLNASTKGVYDLCCLKEDSTFEYFFFVDNAARAVLVTQGANRILSFVKEKKDAAITVVALDEDDLKFCRSQGVPSSFYVAKGSILRRVKSEGD